MKLLNLDDIAIDSERTVTYKGVSYKVRDFSVMEFVKFQKHFLAFQRAYNSTNAEDMGNVVVETKNLVAIGVPDFPIELVEDLNPLQMLALVSMIANLLPEPEAETAAQTEAAQDPKVETAAE